jgi:glutathione S-transferase
MKLYDYTMAPNPRRVRIFIAEKGLDIENIAVDLGAKAQMEDAYRAKNPELLVPALELDDGTIIGESMAICRYLEEVHPEPPLLGRTAIEKATVEMWQRRMEMNGLAAVAEAFRNTVPGFAGRAIAGPHDYDQIPGSCRPRLAAD